MLPDRHAGLELVDQLTTHLEGLTTVPGADPHDHGDITDLQPPDPVHDADAHAASVDGQPLSQRAGDVGSLRVRRVVEMGHVGRVVVVAHHPDEEADAAGRGIGHARHHLVDRQRGIADLGKGHGHDVIVSAGLPSPDVTASVEVGQPLVHGNQSGGFVVVLTNAIPGCVGRGPAHTPISGPINCQEQPCPTPATPSTAETMTIATR